MRITRAAHRRDADGRADGPDDDGERDDFDRDVDDARDVDRHTVGDDGSDGLDHDVSDEQGDDVTDEHGGRDDPAHVDRAPDVHGAAERATDGGDRSQRSRQGADVRAVLSRWRTAVREQPVRVSDALPAEVRLPLDWELWVVEHLLFTAHREDIADALAARGVDRAAAAEQIEAILASPSFERLRARLAEAALASRMERLQRDVALGVDAIETRDTIDAETLHRDHWTRSRPVKIRATAPGLRALDWTLRGLVDRFGDVAIDVNVDRGHAVDSRDVERREAPMTLRAFADRAYAGPTDDLYVVSRNGLLSVEALAPLWDDLAPLPSFLGPIARPRGVSLWAGPEGTRTRPHFDPHNVLLLQVEGEKRVRLSPRPRPEQAARFDGYYLRGDLDPARDRIFEVHLAAGEALFIPAAWIHEVIALAPSMTLSFVAFAWANHFHYLGPPGSDDQRAGADLRG